MCSFAKLSNYRAVPTSELRLSVGLENSPYCRPNASQSTRTGTRTARAIRCRARTHKGPAQAQHKTSVNKRANRCKIRAYKPRLTKGIIRCKHPFKDTGCVTGPWFCRCHCRVSLLSQLLRIQSSAQRTGQKGQASANRGRTRTRMRKHATSR